jgi:hypothetical protein
MILPVAGEIEVKTCSGRHGAKQTRGVKGAKNPVRRLYGEAFRVKVVRPVSPSPPP